jgi:aryl-phospho-beta-D-glucosidase BglC (GH1 family)
MNAMRVLAFIEIGGSLEVSRSRAFSLLCAALFIGSSASAQTIAPLFRIQSDWGTGYVGEIQLSNAGQTPITSWAIEFDLGGQLVSFWNGGDTVTGTHYVVRDLGWNAYLAPGGSIVFGFQIAYSGTRPEPANCRISGVTCSFSGVTSPTPTPPPVVSPPPEPTPPPPPSVVSGFLSMSGATMVDEDGRPVRLTGVNWFGFETATRAVHGLWSRDYRSMLQQVHDLGFNALRIPWSNAILEPGSMPTGITFAGSDPYDGRSPMNQPLQGKTSMEVLDLIVAEAGRLGLKIILDNHSRKPDDFISEGLWYLPDFPESRWIADWKTMALRYRNDPTVVAFDLHNEPHNQASWGGDPATDFAGAYERAAAAIHSVHPDVIIIAGGVQTYAGISYWWGGNLRGVRTRPLQIDPAKLLYSAHDYGPEVFPQTWFSAPDFPNNLIPLWDETWGYIPRLGLGGVFIGEFGIGHSDAYGGRALQWIQSLMAYMGRSSSWTYWSLNPNSGDTGGILKDDWVGVNQWKLDLLRPYQAAQFEPAPLPEPGANAQMVAAVGALLVIAAWRRRRIH